MLSKLLSAIIPHTSASPKWQPRVTPAVSKRRGRAIISASSLQFPGALLQLAPSLSQELVMIPSQGLLHIGNSPSAAVLSYIQLPGTDQMSRTREALLCLHYTTPRMSSCSHEHIELRTSRSLLAMHTSEDTSPACRNSISLNIVQTTFSIGRTSFPCHDMNVMPVLRA